ncbi:metallophosphoesterase [Deinococcus sp. AJ005]|uniref:metallophosphoesterase family protein n=1 Tax=Deinococcus sp. AJ005 TaxID=2652443 RepID=UPI00125CAD8C|nr:metallophosphoesterase family protein [Deinococcus sp. AJ005]QFP76148.1 metallophosphoesterase family protein [Deinococcus sp. AJ005]
MRLAIYGDVHDNLPALEAALADMDVHSPDALICLGDVTAGGAWPRECLQLVAALGCPVVRGNADREALEAPQPLQVRGLPDEQEIHDIGQWGAAQLTGTERDILRSFAPTVALDDLLCFHGSPAKDDEVLDAGTNHKRLEELREEYGKHAVWIGGHTHQPLLRSLDGWRLLNPGSVGLPFQKRGGKYVNLAYAEYLLLDSISGGWMPTFRRVPYDLATLKKGILASGIPHAQWLADEWVPG